MKTPILGLLMAVVLFMFAKSGQCDEQTKPLGVRPIADLLKLIRDGSGNDRLNAMSDIVQYGPEAKVAVPLLMAARDDEQPFNRCHAAVCLWLIAKHPQAVPTLVEVCQDEDPFTARIGVIRLAEIGLQHPAVLPAALAALQHRDWRVNEAAQSTLLEMRPGPDHAKELIQVFRGAEFFPASFLVSIVLEQMDQQAIPPLTDGLRDSNPLVRSRSECLLARIRNRRPLRRAEPVTNPDKDSLTSFDRRAAIHVVESFRKGVIQFDNNDRDSAVVGVRFVTSIGSDRELGNLKLFPNLQTLTLMHCSGVGDTSLEQISELTQLRALSLISCHGTKLTGRTGITSNGLRYLAGLKDLRSLQLANTDIGDDGLAHLTGLSALEELNVSYTKVTDAGMKHIAKLTGLRFLDVSDTVTDDGLKHLASLKDLRGLTLRGTTVSNTGLETLAQVTSLQHLDISNTDVTENGIKQFRKLLPECQVCFETRN